MTGVAAPQAAPAGHDAAAQRAGLRHKVSSGLAWSMVNSLVSRAGQFVVGAILAHLIAPKEFGVWAVALVAFAVVMSVNELGVTVAIIRAPGDVSAIAPTVTTLAIASSALFGGACMLGASAFARALGAPEAAGVLRILALAVPIGGLTATPYALLQRDFRQGRRFLIDMANFVLSTVVSIVLAVATHSAVALAWSRVAGNAISGMLLVALVSERYRPGFDFKTARQLLAFSPPLAASSFVVFAVLNVDYVVVGHVLGPVALGFYLLTFNLSSWPVNAFSNVVRQVSLPGFSKLLDDQDHARAVFIRSLAMLLTITSPVCVLLAGLAGPLVDVLYGARWHPAAAALVLLAGLGLFRVAHELAYDFLVALGKSRAVLGIQLLWLAVLIPCLTLAAHVGGIRGVGTGHLVVAFCVVGAAYLVALRSVRVNLRELARHQVRPLLAAGLGGVSAYAAARVLPGDLVRLVVGGTVGLAVYAAVAYPLLRSMVALARPGSARHLGAHRGPTRSAVLAAARVLLPARARAGAR